MMRYRRCYLHPLVSLSLWVTIRRPQRSCMERLLGAQVGVGVVVSSCFRLDVRR
jgi:hypothetical protein